MYQMAKFKKGDVVLVKENTSGGHPAGTIARVVGVRPFGSGVDITGLPGSRYEFSLVHEESDLRKIAKFDKEFDGSNQTKLNIKRGEVVYLKENRCGGFKEGTICRVKAVSSDGGRVELAEISKRWDITYFHTMKELRKIKGYDQ
jgi:hypothetical protein